MRSAVGGVWPRMSHSNYHSGETIADLDKNASFVPQFNGYIVKKAFVSTSRAGRFRKTWIASLWLACLRRQAKTDDGTDANRCLREEWNDSGVTWRSTIVRRLGLPACVGNPRRGSQRYIQWHAKLDVFMNDRLFLTVSIKKGRLVEGRPKLGKGVFEPHPLIF